MLDQLTVDDVESIHVFDPTQLVAQLNELLVELIVVDGFQNQFESLEVGEVLLNKHLVFFEEIARFEITGFPTPPLIERLYHELDVLLFDVFLFVFQL